MYYKELQDQLHRCDEELEKSDLDLYGFCVPPKTPVFPHLAGELPGFGTQLKRFEQYQQNGLTVKGEKWDISIYSIVKYFQLCMNNNPNMIDSLYTPKDCIESITKVGKMVRDNRDRFLHKGAWHTFRGYAYSQISRITKERKKSNRRSPRIWHKTCLPYSKANRRG